MFEHLLSPFTIKNVTIPNRFAVSAMVTNFCDENGYATEKFIAYHEGKAKGGWGLIITEDYSVDPLGKGFKQVAGLWDDSQIAANRDLTERVHAHGSKILAQIYHCGRQTTREVIGETPVAPSVIHDPIGKDIPRALTIDEIHHIVWQFGEAARRAKEAGFDGIELHGGHGYLMAEFMSTHSNRRVDQYGGGLQNRMRFALECIEAVKQYADDNFIIGYRISMDEKVYGGRRIEESLAILPFLEAAGVDLINASAGVYGARYAITPSCYTDHGWLLEYAARARKAVSIPVLAVGRITDPIMAEQALRNEQCDLVAMSRASLADPDLPNKVKAGKPEEARHCIGCNNCSNYLYTQNPITCTVNPELGRTHLNLVQPAGTKKNIAVVGAGPGGMEAAMIAAQRGHKVTIFEKGPQAGGRFRIASIPPSKQEITDFLIWQQMQLDKLGVTIRYGTEATADLLAEGGFDEVIVATGSAPVKPRIPGSEKPLVCTAEDVLEETVPVVNRYVIIGGGQTGAETANHLGLQGKEVAIVEMTHTIAANEPTAAKAILLPTLREYGVQMLTDTKVEEILDNGVKVLLPDGAERFLPADLVVMAIGAKPCTELAEALEKKGIPCRVIGDARKTRDAVSAVTEGFEEGRLV